MSASNLEFIQAGVARHHTVVHECTPVLLAGQSADCSYLWLSYCRMQKMPPPGALTLCSPRYGSLSGDVRTVLIRDPAGQARTLAFDHGWLGMARVSEPSKPDKGKQPEEG